MSLQRFRLVILSGVAVTGIAAALAWPSDEASAQSFRRGGDYSYTQRRPVVEEPAPMTPVFAVVSLNEQRISVYGTNGRLLQSPVSSGNTGYETPSGIFSIVQKKPEHHSNLYDDASMPFMQRITWTGIALHAGALPGYAASHGCVRLPIAFAQQLFDVTKLGMRVILTREDILPESISHPALFKPRPLQASIDPVRAPVIRASVRGELPISRLGNLAFENVLTPSPTAERYLGTLSAVARVRNAEAEKANRRAAEVRQVAQRKAAEAAMATRTIKGAELNIARSDDMLKGAVKALEAVSANPNAKPEAVKAAEVNRDKAQARLADARADLEKAKAQNQAKIDAAEQAAEELRQADLARDQAHEASEEATRKLSPVSVFVSRKMRRFYVRQANLPVMEGPVTIRDPERTIGSFVYTAMDFTDQGASDMRWNVVSLYKSLGEMPKEAPASVKPNDKPPAQPAKKRGEAVPADVAGAKAALDRIQLPPEAVERVAELLVPGSSLIISDEGASIETGKDTDFVVVMSNEPQGALKIRAPQPRRERPDRYESGGSPFGFWFN